MEVDLKNMLRQSRSKGVRPITKYNSYCLATTSLKKTRFLLGGINTEQIACTPDI